MMSTEVRTFAERRLYDLLAEADEVLEMLMKDDRDRAGQARLAETPDAAKLLTQARRLLAKNKDTSLASFDISLALDRINGRSRHGLLRQASA